MAARARAYLQDGVLLVGLVLREKHELELGFEILDAFLDFTQIGLGEFAYLRFGRSVGKDGLKVLPFAFRRAQAADLLRQFLKLGFFWGELGIFVRRRACR